MPETPLPDRVLDTEDAVCPVPVLMTREAMKELKEGQILKIVTRDPAARTDISVWAGRRGSEVLRIEESDGYVVLYLRKSVSKIVSEADEDLQMSTKRVRHLRLYLGEGEPRTVESDVTLEVPVHLKLNGRDEVTIMATPNRLEDLAVGYLLDEGIVDDLKEVRRLEVRGNDVVIETERDVAGRITAAAKTQLITSECVSLEHYLKLTDGGSIPFVKTNYQIDTEELRRLVREFNRRSRDEKRPGGIHSAALFENGEIKYYLLDVSRHSAVDKVLGAGARDNVDFTHSLVMTSGRQPAGMVLKAARMNVPISVSMRGPIYSGILAAQKTGVTLICYATVNRFDVHSRAERIRLR